MISFCNDKYTKNYSRLDKTLLIVLSYEIRLKRETSRKVVVEDFASC